MTTAKLRNLAREAAQSLDWEKAAELYDQAVEAYPYSTYAKPNSLAWRDMHALHEKAKACRAMIGLN